MVMLALMLFLHAVHHDRGPFCVDSHAVRAGLRHNAVGSSGLVVLCCCSSGQCRLQNGIVPMESIPFSTTSLDHKSPSYLFRGRLISAMDFLEGFPRSFSWGTPSTHPDRSAMCS